jgi:hypothetical protein
VIVTVPNNRRQSESVTALPPSVSQRPRTALRRLVKQCIEVIDVKQIVDLRRDDGSRASRRAGLSA